MGWFARSALAVVAAAIVAAGCVGLEGLNGSGGGALPSDSGLREVDAGSPDVTTSDATAPDAGVDGPSDAGSRFCTQRADAAICDDFDDATLASTWNVFLKENGTVTRGGPARSEPNALVFFIPDTGVAPEARVERSIFGPASAITCSWDMSIDKMPLGGFEIFHAYVSAGGTDKLLILRNDSILSAGGAELSFTSVPAGVWARFTLVIDLVAQEARVSKNAGPTTTLPLSGYPIPETTLLSFGNRYKPSGEFTFRFDDLVCDFAP